MENGKKSRRRKKGLIRSRLQRFNADRSEVGNDGAVVGARVGMSQF